MATFYSVLKRIIKTIRDQSGKNSCCSKKAILYVDKLLTIHIEMSFHRPLSKLIAGFASVDS